MKTLLLVLLGIFGCSSGETGRVVRDSVADTTPMTPPAEPAQKADLVRLDQPLPNSVVTSPLMVQGQARGPWYFEASFPVYLLNAAGDTIARTPAQAEGEWMTTNMVPFKATVEFVPPAGDSGTLVLSKSNASGLPEHDDELRVPIRFR